MKMGGESLAAFRGRPVWADRPATRSTTLGLLNDAPTGRKRVNPIRNRRTFGLAQDLRNNLIGLFFQDNYKLRSNLRLDGTPLEYFWSNLCEERQLATVVLGQGPMLLRTSKCAQARPLQRQQTQLRPQLGFAWSPKVLVGPILVIGLVLREASRGLSTVSSNPLADGPLLKSTVRG